MIRDLKKRAEKIYDLLSLHYPEAGTALLHENPFQLLVATILSAQCTDKKVNEVTPLLFKRYPLPAGLAGAEIKDVEALIKPTGFYRNKAKNIMKMSRDLLEKFSGEVPREMEKLTQLSGVGRKTANVVLGQAFGIPGIVVDTHVLRLSGLIGLTGNNDPEKVEFDLQRLLDRDKWTKFTGMLIRHGRAVCVARRPRCGECCLLDQCEFGSGKKA